MLDSEEYVYFYFDNDVNKTYLESLPERYQAAMRDTLYTYVNYKDELIYRN